MEPVKEKINDLLKANNVPFKNLTSGVFKRDGRFITAGIAGWPDILGYGPKGLFWVIECKSKNDKLSPGQVEALNDMAEKGCLAMLYTESTKVERALNEQVRVCRTTDEILFHMREAGIIKQGALF